MSETRLGVLGGQQETKTQVSWLLVGVRPPAAQQRQRDHSCEMDRGPGRARQ